MRSGKFVLIIDFAVGRRLIVEIRAVPWLDAAFVVIIIFARIIPLAVDLIGVFASAYEPPVEDVPPPPGVWPPAQATSRTQSAADAQNWEKRWVFIRFG